MEDLINKDLISLNIIATYKKNNIHLDLDHINSLQSTLEFEWIIAIDENLEGIDDYKGVDVTTFDFYQDFEPGTAGYSQPFLNPEGRSLIAMWVPILDDDSNYIGSVIGGVLLDKYYSVNIFTFYDGEGRTYLFNSDDGDFILKSLGTNGAPLRQNNIYSLLTFSGNSEKDIEEFKEAINNKRAGIAELVFNDEESYLCFLPLNSSKGWYITTVVAENVLLKEADAVQSFIKVSVAIILFTLTLATISLFILMVHRVKSEEANYRNSLFSNLSENIDSVFLFYEKDGKGKVFVSDNVQRLFGTDKKIFEKDINNFFDWCKVDKDDPTKKEFVNGTLAETHIFETNIDDELGNDSNTIRVELIPSDLAQEIIVVTDITKDKLTQNSLTVAMQAAEAANKTKNEFFSAMSHDLRTPINGVVGMTTIALANLDNKEKVADCLQKISDSTSDLLMIINDILELSKIEKGKVNLVHEPFNITDLFQKILNISYPGVKNKNHTVDVEIGEIKHPHVIGDTLKLSRIALNLISNSIKYTPDGGLIKLSLCEKPALVRGYGVYELVVEDNGIGMSEEFLSKGFEPFDREEDVANSDIQGTGLGMSIVKNLLSLMGGTLSIDSKKGVGTKFVVSLNLELNNKIENETKYDTIDVNTIKQIKGKGKKIKILIAEDNELNKEIVLEFLEMLDVSGVWAKNGKEALEIFCASKQGEYDIVFMDINMPVMNGYEASKAIRNSGKADAKTIPIVAMTADVFTDDIGLALAAGMNEHVSKPLSINRLEEVIRKLIGGDVDEKNV